MSAADRSRDLPPERRRPPLWLLLTAAFGLLICASLVAAALTTAHWHREDRTRQLQAFLQRKAAQFGAVVATELDERRRILALNADRLTDLDWQRQPRQARAVLDALRAGWPEFVWLGVADADGTVVAAAGGVLTGARVAERAWFAGGLSGEFIGGLHEALLLQDHLQADAGGTLPRLFDIALPLRDAQGRSAGVLAAHLDQRWLDGLRQRVGQTSIEPQPYRLELIGRDGRPIVQAPATPAARQPVAADAGELVARAALDAGAVAALGWQAQASLPLTEVQREVEQIRRRALLAGGAGALACLPLVLLLSRRLSRPLQLLAQRVRAERRQLGAAGPRVPVAGTRETAALGREVRGLLGEIAAQQAALVDNEARLRALVDAAPDAVISVGEDGRILLVNHAAEAMFGRRADELLGRPLDDLIPARFHARHREHLAAFGRGPRQSSAMGRVGQIVARRADGSEFPIEASIFRSVASGRPLLTAIVRDITLREQADAELRDGRERLAELSRELITKEATERAALGQVLHDRFAQSLVAAKLAVEVTGQRLLAVESPAQAQEAAAGLQPALDLLGESIRDLRGLLNELRPPLLDDFGLRAALQFELDRRQRLTAAPLALESGGDADRRLDRVVEYALFMIAREALHNAVLHARAGRIELRLDVDDAGVQLAVIDDGIGFDLHERGRQPGHLGLVGMQERARTIGAELLVLSRAGGGTTIEVHWPGSSTATGATGPAAAQP